MALRRTLLTERRADVLAAEPGAEAMCAELLTMLTAHLAQQFPQWFRHRGASFENTLLGEAWQLTPSCDSPLAIIGRLVQEDFCLLQVEPNGPRLVAAVLCFPSHWRLAEKLGRPLGPIHDPVPFYAERLARPVDRFFAALKPGRVAVRFNWTVTAIPDLFQASGHNRNDAPPVALTGDIGETVFLRVERQTFRRLPHSGAVAFGIRLHVTPLAASVGQPADARRLVSAIESLPPEMSQYKSILPIRAAVLHYLRDRAGSEGGNDRARST
jgi:hypothetical protein